MKTITLSAETLATLKNFAGINQSIWFKSGNVIKTRSQAKDVYAIATITETLPVDFAVYDLPRFLNVSGLFSENPEMDFGQLENGVMIGQGRNSVRYIFSDPIILPDYCVKPEEYEKNPKMPPVVATFNLKNEQLLRVTKAASVLGSPNVSIVSDGESVKMITHDKKNKLADSFILELEGAKADATFTVDLKLDTLRLIPGEYKVSVGEKIAVRFENQTVPVEYFICGQITMN